ncbi:MAG: glutamate--tRNA ligase family protein, partial [Alphaproteobacteria bacterium]|nr:glutamate--tRNA ligase family protein [Alphaproteobacteria bacterium]
MSVLVRIAPSPTGLLHIGNIRAALFNWLFARKLGGKFMLRLDDTDRERSTQAFAEAIERDLTWLGLNWDIFARQSDRLNLYTAALEKLKVSGRVYPCFETQAELDLKRKTQLGRGLPPVYDRAALKLDDAARSKLIAEGRKPHWRFKLDPADVVWEDAVKGTKKFAGASLSDPVLVREDGVPLYTFCSVVDDVDFGVTHVIRGEDHVTNTAVQIQIWHALSDKPPPIFAHF